MSGPGEGLKALGAALCALGALSLALVLSWRSDAFGLFTFLWLFGFTLGIPLLVAGVGRGRRPGRNPTWHDAPPLSGLRIVALLGLATVVGATIGTVGRIRAEAAATHRWDGERTAVDSQRHEGRPLTTAVHQCADKVLALQLPYNVPEAPEAFARRVVQCVLAREDADTLGFACRPQYYYCSMPVTTRTSRALEDPEAPTYAESFKPQLEQFLRGG